jgi:hypothetical protein
MQALMRPWPGGTWLQNCLISGLQACKTARAPGRICAIAPGVESNKIVPIITALFVSMSSSIANGATHIAQNYYSVGSNHATVSNPGTTGGLVGQILLELRIDIGVVVGLVLCRDRVLDLDRYGSGGPLLLFLQGIYRR